MGSRMADLLLDKSERGEGRELRIAKSEWKGRAFYHVREWYWQNNQWQPGKGIALWESELALVASALDRAAGIIDAPDPTADWGNT